MVCLWMLLAILISILGTGLTCSSGNILIMLGFHLLDCCIFHQSLTYRHLRCYLIVLIEVIRFGSFHVSILFFSIFVITTLVCLFEGLTNTSTFSSLDLLANPPKLYYILTTPNNLTPHHVQVPHELPPNTSKTYSNPSSTVLPPSSPYSYPSSQPYTK